MSEKPLPIMTRGDYLWSAGILMVIATGFIAHITYAGDPANSLHQKALDGWLSLCWAAAGLAAGGIFSAVASLLRRP